MWEFKRDEHLDRILVEPVEVDIAIQIGEEQQTIRIPMVRFL
jgi:hypothetical protein